MNTTEAVAEFELLPMPYGTSLLPLLRSSDPGMYSRRVASSDAYTPFSDLTELYPLHPIDGSSEHKCVDVTNTSL